MPLRIAFLSLSHRFDDTRILVKEAATLAAAGHRVTHFAPDRGTTPPPSLHDVRIVTYRRGRGLTGLLGRTGRLWRLAWRERPDVCHANEPQTWLLALTLRWFRPGMRVVFDVHEHYPSRFAEPRFPRWLRYLGEPATRLLFRWLGPRTDLVIYAKRSVAPDFPPQTRGEFIFNYAFPGTPPEPGPVSLPPGFETGPVAVHLGGLNRQRGWPQLLEALARMRHRELKVLALGEVEDGREAFEAEARRLGVAQRIVVGARVPYASLFGVLAHCTVGLMLYQPGILNHTYAFPMKLYDYMRAGLPVIGPDFAVEVTPVVEGEACGQLIDTADPDALAAALDAVCEAPEAARAAGARGRAAVEREYNWGPQGERLRQLYNSLEQARTARPA